MEREKLHELIVGTRNAIASRGHAKNVLEDDRGRVCLYGGFLVASGFPASSRGVRVGQEELSEFAQALGFPCALAAVLWNNDHERTEREVLDLLDAKAVETGPEPEDLDLYASEAKQAVTV